MSRNKPCKVTINPVKFREVISNQLHLENKDVANQIGHSDSFITHVCNCGYMSLSDFILFSVLYVNEFDENINTIFDIAPVREEYENEVTEAIRRVYMYDDEKQVDVAESTCEDENLKDISLSLSDMVGKIEKNDDFDKLREVIFTSVYNALICAKDY